MPSHGPSQGIPLCCSGCAWIRHHTHPHVRTDGFVYLLPALPTVVVLTTDDTDVFHGSGWVMPVREASIRCL